MSGVQDFYCISQRPLLTLLKILLLPINMITLLAEEGREEERKERREERREERRKERREERRKENREERREERREARRKESRSQKGNNCFQYLKIN